ncbi:MAG: SRPBCC domain-containing protein [bacterium]
MKTQPIIMERTFDAPVPNVWKAISDKKEMKNWYFDIAEFKPEKGFEFEFLAGGADKKYLHLCKVTEVVEGKKLSYDWRYDGYSGVSNVTFELFPEGDKTKLKLTHTGLETFPLDNPDFAKKNFEAGWTSILDKSLKNYLTEINN